MRLVVVDDCSYELYNQIRNAIFGSIPFGIINAEYCLGKGFFYFWDESYIPERLGRLCNIEGNKAKVNECNRKIIEILEDV